MPSHYIPVPFGTKTFAFLSECATCGYFGGDYAEVEPDGFCAWGERNDGKAASCQR